MYHFAVFIGTTIVKFSKEAVLNVEKASATKLVIGDVEDDLPVAYTFKYTNPQGVPCDGHIEEWVGNDGLEKDWWVAEAEYEAPDEHSYVRIGAGGSGAEEVFVREDGLICYRYCNAFDDPIELTKDFEAFVSMLIPVTEL